MKLGFGGWRLAGLVVAGALFAAAPAAQATVFNGLTVGQFKALLTTQGVVFTEVEPGLYRIQDGPLIQLTQCLPEDNNACYEVQIGRTFSNVKPTLDAVNRWNYSTKIPEASIDDQGRLHMEFWLTTVGMTEQLLADSIGWFENAWKGEEAQAFWQPYMTGPGV